MLSVKVSPWLECRDDATMVRTEVFIVEQCIDPALGTKEIQFVTKDFSHLFGTEMDSMDPVCDHAVARVGQDVVGTGRLLPDGHIGRMAVRKPWRGRHVGAGIILALEQRARERGMKNIALNAQTSAQIFYEKQGYRQVGDLFFEAGIEHISMTKDL